MGASMVIREAPMGASMVLWEASVGASMVLYRGRFDGFLIAERDCALRLKVAHAFAAVFGDQILARNAFEWN